MSCKTSGIVGLVLDWHDWALGTGWYLQACYRHGGYCTFRLVGTVRSEQHTLPDIGLLCSSTDVEASVTAGNL